MAQVDLGVRVHRNRPLEALSLPAALVLRTALVRAGIPLSQFPTQLLRPGDDPITVDYHERPPLAEIPTYRADGLAPLGSRLLAGAPDAGADHRAG